MGNYQVENVAILDDLPLLPGARVAAGPTSTAVHGDDGGGPALGWITRTEFTTPGSTTSAAILGFYESHLVGWAKTETCCGTIAISAAFERGGATLSVNADNADHGRFELVTDAHGERTMRAANR